MRNEFRHGHRIFPRPRSIFPVPGMCFSYRRKVDKPRQAVDGEGLRPEIRSTAGSVFAATLCGGLSKTFSNDAATEGFPQTTALLCGRDVIHPAVECNDDSDDPANLRFRLDDLRMVMTSCKTVLSSSE